MSDHTMPPPVGGQVYSTKQAAELTGVPEATIRSWKQRGKFDSSHNFKDDSGNTLWTDAGLQEIQRLSGATVSNANTATDYAAPITTPHDAATVNAANNATQCDAATEDMAVLLAPLADAIALEVIRQQLPPAIKASIHRLLTSTDANDQARLQRLLEGMGLVLAQSALNIALQHAIATSQQSMKALGGRYE
jgi:DNA-binding transcriptional MerR regulator